MVGPAVEQVLSEKPTTEAAAGARGGGEAGALRGGE
jgi:hypothetical protein